MNGYVSGEDYASQLGRAIIGLNLAFVYQQDPEWAVIQLFPKLHFSKVGKEAFLFWEPHARYGKLSRDLILVIAPIYREAFPFFHDVNSHLQTGFFGHIACIVCSCLIEVDKGKWFRDFLTGLNEDEKASWASEVERCLRGGSVAQRMQVWNLWMKTYWADRVRGVPCPIQSKEAEKMLEWSFVVGKAFPDAVDLVVRGPRIEQHLGFAFYKLEQHEAPEKHPEAVLRLLGWLLKDRPRQWMNSERVEPVLFRLPKRKAFLPLVNGICQQLASLSYSGAPELKRRIEQEFTED